MNVVLVEITGATNVEERTKADKRRAKDEGRTSSGGLIVPRLILLQFR